MVGKVKMVKAILMVTVALTAVAISASFAGAAQAKQWYTGTPEKLLKGSTAMTMSLLKGQSGEKQFKFGWTLGHEPNVEVSWAASGVECVGCKISNEFPKAGTAAGTGRIKFTGVTGVSPTNCVYSGESEKGTLTTRELAWEFKTVGGREYVYFYPLSGTTYLTFYVSGGDCAAFSGSYNITGTLYALNTGSLFSKSSVLHELSFSEAIQKEAGGHLTTGSYPITVEGLVSEGLSSGQSWAAH